MKQFALHALPLAVSVALLIAWVTPGVAVASATATSPDPGVAADDPPVPLTPEQLQAAVDEQTERLRQQLIEANLKLGLPRGIAESLAGEAIGKLQAEMNNQIRQGKKLDEAFGLAQKDPSYANDPAVKSPVQHAKDTNRLPSDWKPGDPTGPPEASQPSTPATTGTTAPVAIDPGKVNTCVLQVGLERPDLTFEQVLEECTKRLEAEARQAAPPAGSTGATPTTTSQAPGDCDPTGCVDPACIGSPSRPLPEAHVLGVLWLDHCPNHVTDSTPSPADAPATTEAITAGGPPPPCPPKNGDAGTIWASATPADAIAATFNEFGALWGDLVASVTGCPCDGGDKKDKDKDQDKDHKKEEEKEREEKKREEERQKKEDEEHKRAEEEEKQKLEAEKQQQAAGAIPC